MMRRLALAVGLVALLAAPAQAQRAGLYDVEGTNLDGSAYRGQAQIEQLGLNSFAIRWRIGNQIVEGVGMASGRTIAVAYGVSQRPGIGIYTLKPDGSMEGEWTIVGAPAIGTERLVPREAPPAANPTPAPSTPAQPPAETPATPSR